MKYGEKNWKKVCSLLTNRNGLQCMQRWSKVLRPGLTKTAWTPEVRVVRISSPSGTTLLLLVCIQEDKRLLEFVDQHGTKSWSFLSTQFLCRTGKQCRER